MVIVKRGLVLIILALDTADISQRPLGGLASPANTVAAVQLMMMMMMTAQKSAKAEASVTK